MVRFVKISTRKYKVFDEDEELAFTIKRVDNDCYIVRSLYNDKMVFQTLQDAKAFIRDREEENKSHDSSIEEPTTNTPINWLEFFIQNTRGKKFDSKQKSNEHMKMLSRYWKLNGRPTEQQQQECSAQNGCFCNKKNPPTTTTIL